MNPTPTASDERNRYGRSIEEAFEAAAKLAGSNLAPTEFYEQFLNRTLSAIDAPAGAVWLRTPQGFLQVACQTNLEKVGLDARRGGRQCHNEVLRQVFQATPPRPGRTSAALSSRSSSARTGSRPRAQVAKYFGMTGLPAAVRHLTLPGPDRHDNPPSSPPNAGVIDRIRPEADVDCQIGRAPGSANDRILSVLST